MSNKLLRWSEKLWRLLFYVTGFWVLILVFALLGVPGAETFFDKGISHGPLGWVAGGLVALWFFLSVAGIVLSILPATARKVKLQKDDIYFLVAFLWGIATFILGHFWR